MHNCVFINWFFFLIEKFGDIFGVDYESENIAVIKSCTKIFVNICFHLTRIKKPKNEIVGS